VTVDELLILALALNVAPVHLLVPPDDYEAPYPVTATVTAPNHRVRGWIRGLYLLRRLPRVGDYRDFFSEVPPDEFEARQEGQCIVCGGHPPRVIKTTPSDGSTRVTFEVPGKEGGDGEH
jgi:hypothetical protein